MYLTPLETDLENATSLAVGIQFAQRVPATPTDQFAARELSDEASALPVTRADSTQVAIPIGIGGNAGLPIFPGDFGTGVVIDDPEADAPVGALAHADTFDQN